MTDEDVIREVEQILEREGRRTQRKALAPGSNDLVTRLNVAYAAAAKSARLAGERETIEVKSFSI